jgi:uncharacterized phage-associated protein
MFRRNGHDAIAVANEMLGVAQGRGRNLTIMQLLKLVYFAHGWSLATFDRPLIRDEVQAWQYGPVIPRVYNAFAHTRGAPITSQWAGTNGAPLRANLTADEQALLVDVFEGYGHLHAFQLSDLTHQAGTPWLEVFNTSGAYSPIPDETIKRYFKALAAEAEPEREMA